MPEDPENDAIDASSCVPDLPSDAPAEDRAAEAEPDPVPPKSSEAAPPVEPPGGEGDQPPAASREQGSEPTPQSNRVFDSEDRDDRASISFTGGQASDTEEPLGEALHYSLGPDLARELAKEICHQDDAIRPGLNVVVMPLPFALAWIKENLDLGAATPTVRHGHGQLLFSQNLTALAQAYSAHPALVVLVDRAAGDNYFRVYNPDFASLDAYCQGQSLAMVLVLTQGHQRHAPWTHSQDPVIRKAVRELPKPTDLLGALLPPAQRQALDGIDTAFIDFEVIERALKALREGKHETLAECLQSLKTDSVPDALRSRFHCYAVKKESRDPTAAAALFLGAHFSGIRSVLFQQLIEVLRLGAIACWGDREAEQSSSGEWVQRPWPGTSDDEALSNVGLHMAKVEQGARQVQFQSERAGELYKDLFASEASRLNNFFYRTLIETIRPLDFGLQLIGPFSQLVASRIRDDFADRPSVELVVKELVDIIEWHRREFDVAKRDLQVRLETLSAPEDLIGVLNQHLTALQAEQRTETARDVSPYFVSIVLKSTYAQFPEDQKQAVQVLVRRVQADRIGSDSERDAFWRQVAMGVSFRTNPEGAFAETHDLFRGNAKIAVLLCDDVGPAAVNGLRFAPETLVSLLVAAHRWVLAGERRAFAWRFSHYLPVLIVWMHSAADASAEQDARALAGGDLSASFAGLLLDRRTVSALRHLNDLHLELAREADPESDDLALALGAGTTAFRLSVALLRMLFRLSGGRQYKKFAEQIDALKRPKIDFYDKVRWMTPEARAMAGQSVRGSHFDGLAPFSQWIEQSMGMLATGLIAKECDLAGADPVERTKRAIEAARDKGYAKQLLSSAWGAWRDSFTMAFHAGEPSDTREGDLRRQADIVRQISNAAKNFS